MSSFFEARRGLLLGIALLSIDLAGCDAEEAPDETAVREPQAEIVIADAGEENPLFPVVWGNTLWWADSGYVFRHPFDSIDGEVESIFRGSRPMLSPAVSKDYVFVTHGSRLTRLDHDGGGQVDLELPWAGMGPPLLVGDVVYLAMPACAAVLRVPYDLSGYETIQPSEPPAIEQSYGQLAPLGSRLFCAGYTTVFEVGDDSMEVLFDSGQRIKKLVATGDSLVWTDHQGKPDVASAVVVLDLGSKDVREVMRVPRGSGPPADYPRDLVRAPRDGYVLLSGSWPRWIDLATGESGGVEEEFSHWSGPLIDGRDAEYVYWLRVRPFSADPQLVRARMEDVLP